MITSLEGLIEKLATFPMEVAEFNHKAMEKACLVVEKEVKAEIGTYQTAVGDFPAWAELADSTKEDRVRQGYTENDPLLRDGTLRDSVTHEVDADGSKGIVSSDSDIAVYQELGTSRIPPRPFFGGAAFRKAEHVQAILGTAMVGALAGPEVFNGAIKVIGD
jgi:hypothetical protein